MHALATACRAIAVVAVVIALTPITHAQQYLPPPTGGQWSGPFYLDVSCDSDPDPCALDEIGHAALIPTGPYAGHLLFWTRCDFQPTAGIRCTPNKPYVSHIWDPVSHAVVLAPSFQPAVSTQDGMFCSGHCWILDSAGNPLLLAVGGTRHIAGAPAHEKAIWFDPGTASWSDTPADLPDPSWYPSIIPYVEPGTDESFVLGVGGTTFQGSGCNTQYADWWVYDVAANSWTTRASNDGYYWQDYPHTLLLTTRTVISVGHDVICEDAGHYSPGDSYGGNPAQLLEFVGTTQQHAQGPDPNTPSPTVGGWHHNNVVVMHTLKEGWTWEGDPLAEYDLNRVIALEGTIEASGPNTDGMTAVLELQGATTGMYSWCAKASAPTGRVFSNAVVLPDGSIVVVGGQNELGIAPGSYWFSAERFDPQDPTDLGTWQTLNSSPIVDTVENVSTPRGYHSIAVLLPDGSVTVGGGLQDLRDPYINTDSGDSAEIFKPTYFFKLARPLIQQAPANITYGTNFCLTVSSVHPIDHACLIGIGSVTHHFDYGQRYIELMTRVPGPVPPPTCAPGSNLELIPPPDVAMAPEGYYLLFVVDRRTNGDLVPSAGKIVKLTK